MREKARQNLEAARLLVERGLFDAAASRLYYAAFQAAVWALGRQGLRPDSIRLGARHWDHSMVAESASLVRGRPEDVLLFRQLRRLRTHADYEQGPTDRRDLEGWFDAAGRFISETLG